MARVRSLLVIQFPSSLHLCFLFSRCAFTVFHGVTENTACLSLAHPDSLFSTKIRLLPPFDGQQTCPAPPRTFFVHHGGIQRIKGTIHGRQSFHHTIDHAAGLRNSRSGVSAQVGEQILQITTERPGRDREAMASSERPATDLAVSIPSHWHLLRHRHHRCPRLGWSSLSPRAIFLCSHGRRFLGRPG